MAMNLSADTAKIYEFPAGGRKRVAGRFEQAATVTDFRAQQAVTLDYGNWYHDEAIRQSETAPKS